MTHRTIGVDLAIRGNHVAQIFEDGRPLGPPLRFRHDPASLDAFVARATAGLGDADSVQAVMEPTGMSWFPVAHRLADAGVEVARVKGKRVRALRRYLSEHAKTDLADAQVLAAMPGFGEPRLDPVHSRRQKPCAPAAHEAARPLSEPHRRQQASPDRNRPLGVADPRARAARPEDAPCPGVAARHPSGNHPRSGPFVDALVDGLRQAARTARALHRSQVDFAELQAEVTVEVDATLDDIEAVAVLQCRIDALYAELQPNDVLRSIPGVGQHLAPILIGVLHTADRFRSERHIRGFCGLFPRRADSGGAERPGQRITQGGNNRIKRALMLAADTARKIDPELAEVYWRLMTVRGHHHKQALCAVANRLVNRILSVLRSGKPYGLRDLDGRPIGVAEAKAIVLQRFTVPDGVRASRRANRTSIAV